MKKENPKLTVFPVRNKHEKTGREGKQHIEIPARFIFPDREAERSLFLRMEAPPHVYLAGSGRPCAAIIPRMASNRWGFNSFRPTGS